MSEHTALQEDIRDLQAEVAALRAQPAPALADLATELLALAKRRGQDPATRSAAVALSRRADAALLAVRTGVPCPDCGGTGRLPGDPA